MRGYGLEETPHPLWHGSVQVAGKKLLAIHRDALQQVFGINPYQDYKDLWQIGGMIDRAAQQAQNTARGDAVKHFQDSLNLRKKQAQAQGAHGGSHRGHEVMIKCLQECIRHIS